MARLQVFVACPYLLFPLDDYKAIFSKTAKAYDVAFKFADEQITNQHILTKVTNYIRDHDFSIFDITGWNPNVALELGIAVGLGKKYFILFNGRLDPNKDAPSDIKGIDRIQYGSNSELEAKLILLIKQEIKETKNRYDSVFDGLKERIVSSLVDEPGIGLSKLAGLITEDKNLVQSVVRAMVQAGELKTRGQKRGTVYYPSDFDFRKARR